MDVFLSRGRADGKTVPLVQIEFVLIQKLAEIRKNIYSANLDYLVRELADIIKTVDLDIEPNYFSKFKKLNLEMDSKYRHLFFNSDTRLIEDIVFGKIKLSLKNMDDYYILLNQIKGHLYRQVQNEIQKDYLIQFYEDMGNELLPEMSVKSSLFEVLVEKGRAETALPMVFLLNKKMANFFYTIKAKQVLSKLLHLIVAEDPWSQGWENEQFLYIADVVAKLTKKEKVAINFANKIEAIPQFKIQKLSSFKKLNTKDFISVRLKPSLAITFSWMLMTIKFLAAIVLVAFPFAATKDSQNNIFVEESTVVSTDDKGVSEENQDILRQQEALVIDSFNEIPIEGINPEADEIDPLIGRQSVDEVTEKAVLVRTIVQKELTEPVFGIAPPGLYYFEDSHIDFQNKLNPTFDDGPNLNKIMVSHKDGDKREVGVTEEILNILKDEDIQATFFINGKNIIDFDENPIPGAKEILVRMIDEGHIIASHSFAHDNLSKGIYNDGQHDIEDILADLEKNRSALDTVLGYHYEMNYFRPPYAEAGRNSKVDEAVNQLKNNLIILQIDSFDYLMNRNAKPWSKDQVVKTLFQSIEESTGGTILMHDLPQTVEILREIIQGIQSRSNENGGFVIATIDDLMVTKNNANSLAIAKAPDE